MCKVYTGYHGTSETEHGFVPLRSIIPSLKLGDYLYVQAQKPCSISHIANSSDFAVSNISDFICRIAVINYTSHTFIIKTYI